MTDEHRAAPRHRILKAGTIQFGGGAIAKPRRMGGRGVESAALGVNQSNLLAALEMVIKRNSPPEVVEACMGKFAGVTSR
jgi:hypothetical protein